MAVLEAGPGGPLAAGHELRLAATDPNVALDLVDGRCVDQRPDVHALVKPVAQAQRGRPGLEAAAQVVRDGRVHDHPRARRAPLARGPERRPQDPVHGEVEVGVAQDDNGVLAAELEADALEQAARPLRDAAPGVGRARERDHRHVAAVDDRVAHLGPGSGDEVDGAGREARLVHELDEQGRAQRRLRGRLEHDGVAGDQRGHHLPARDRDREVPRGDDPGDADRLADAHRPLVGQLRWHRVAEHPAAFAGHQEGDVDPLLDVAPRLGDDLAHLRASSPGPGAPCAPPSARRSGTGPRLAWAPGSRPTRARQSRRRGWPSRRPPPSPPGTAPLRRACRRG